MTYQIEIPDIFKNICNFIEHDIDFINLTMTCQLFYTYTNLRDLVGTYSLNKISNSQDRYIFTKILYDKKLKIPCQVHTVKLSDDFTYDLSYFYSYNRIKIIDVGIYYTNTIVLSSIPDRLNKRDIITTIISNEINKKEFTNEFAILNGTGKHTFPRCFNKASCYIIKKKIYKKYLELLCQEDIKLEDVKGLRQYIIINESSPSRRERLTTIRNLLNMTDIYSKYVRLFENYDINNKTDRILLAELIQLLIDILDKERLYNDTVFDMIVRKYKLQDRYQYLLYVLTLWNLDAGYSEISSIKELSVYPKGSIVSYKDKNGIYSEKGYLLKVGDDHFEFATRISRSKAFKSNERYLKFIKDNTMKVDIKDIEKIWVADISKDKSLYVTITQEPITSYPLIINDKTVHYFENDRECKNYVKSRHYNRSINWMNLFDKK